jgi:hypothetical protein
MSKTNEKTIILWYDRECADCILEAQVFDDESKAREWLRRQWPEVGRRKFRPNDRPRIITRISVSSPEV